jgi:hypothetical protein
MKKEDFRQARKQKGLSGKRAALFVFRIYP